MFSFNIVFPKNWSEEQTLPNTPVEGINFYSPLGRVVSCLQGDFADTLFIKKSTLPPVLVPFQLSDLYKQFIERENKDRKRFFLKTHPSEDFGWREVGEEKDLSKSEFQILCSFLKKTTQLKHLYFQSETFAFTEEEEQELINVIKENDSIQSIKILGGTQEMANEIKAINRPSLEVFTLGLITREKLKFQNDDKYRAQVVQQYINEQNLKHAQAVQDAMNMHILQGFVAVLGAAAVATAFVLLNAATLNLAGIVLATAGTGALAWSAHSFFSYSPPNHKAFNLAEQQALKRKYNVPLDEEIKIDEDFVGSCKLP